MTKLKTELAKEIKEETVDAIEATESFVLKARDVATTTLTRGARAYVGLFGLAYDRASARFAKLTAGREELMTDLVKRGEVIEKQALVAANDAKARVVKLYAEGAEKVRDVVPTRGERVEELEAEVEKLSKKIKAMNAKAASKTTTKKTATKKAA